MMVRGSALALALLLVSGCASTLSARVTSYAQWPAGVQGATYRMAPGARQVNNLEYQAFADMIRASIGPTGLVEAKAGEPARFDVSFDYGNPATQTWVQQYNDPYFYNGFGWGHGGYHGWSGAMLYMPSTVNVPVTVYENSLTVRINDNKNHGAEVYRSRAVSMTGSDNLLKVMPYLARAVFDGFPGNNGQTRDINFELRRR
jgi:hypothetical protein